MRVVHIITRLIIGGAQENTLLTVEGLQRMPGYDVVLITGPALGPEGELVERARRNGVHLDIIDEMRREIHPIRDSIALAKLVRRLKEYRPHVVHTHSSKAGILGRLAAHILRVPVILHTIHGLPFHPYESRWRNRLFIALERLAARWSDRIVTVADAMIGKCLAARVAHRSKFVTIYSGMEVERFLRSGTFRQRVRKELGFRARDVVIGKIARLFELKGHDFVLDAAPEIMARHPNIRLLFVGDGLWRGRLEKKARRLGIAERVTFCGLVDPSRIPAMISAMDIVVHASLREGLARVLPQAFLCGKPVVSFDVDGAREVVIGGETGWLVPAECTAALREALLAAVENRGQARKLARKGRAICKERFPAEIMVQRIAQLYQELLNR
ncbi:MAG: glycosyltransferase family 4 protein [Planctomycetes bacterium]|nr:glycosyltransferase family 4 protein [Planctomycetota bacterium]